LIVFQPTLSLQQRIFSAIERSWPVHLLDSDPDSQFLPEEFTCEEELYILPQKYAYEYEVGMFLAKMLYFTSFFCIHSIICDDEKNLRHFQDPTHRSNILALKSKSILPNRLLLLSRFRYLFLIIFNYLFYDGIKKWGWFL